jgi:MoaA/NifB/PqqE/SkfB family radical SAM enzyme/uncharacterized cupin superfamily protein
MIKHRNIRIDASTVCQLKCPSCPTASGETGEKLGLGFLKLNDFKNLIDSNPHVSHVELSNWGEIFLNKELIDIMKYAYTHDVLLFARNGANLNNVHYDVLEALVKYKFRAITCSIDGATQEAYSVYRAKGNFQQVIENIKTINRFKVQYRSRYPVLIWQFVAFGHNEHEISKARKMAKDLNMGFYVKLSWEDLYSEAFSPVKDLDLIKEETGLGVSSRNEFRVKYRKEYTINCCVDLWKNPQINYDGKVLGCSVNFWDNYGNAFEDGLEECLNSEKINYAREMLMGKREIREDIPCSLCKFYENIKQRKNWITNEDVGGDNGVGRTLHVTARKLFGSKLTDLLFDLFVKTKRLVTSMKRIMKGGGMRIKRILLLNTGTERMPASRLLSKVYPVQIPLEPDVKERWKPYYLFSGFTSGMRNLSCHVSVLVQGHSPHPPHTHKEEELLLVLDGEVEIIIPDGLSPDDFQRRRLKRGEFVYYPASFAHSLKTVSEAPANYLMYKWNAHRRRNKAVLKFCRYSVLESSGRSEVGAGFRPHLLFEGPTNFLKKLHCHISTLSPQAGYDPHADDYDVSIVILEGEVETLGKRVGPNSVIFYAAGEPHGMYNPGEVTARYIVFEFHRHQSILSRVIQRLSRMIK